MSSSSNVISNISANCSTNQIFEPSATGDSTPTTQSSTSNVSIPQCYIYYPPTTGMMIVPDGKSYNYLPIPVLNSTPNVNFNAVQKSVMPHPRFMNVPKEKINGKMIPYNQAKGLIYPTTRGSTIPSDLAQAHRHLYRYANLNNTFESVNNRYGCVDSLDVFKVSSGITVTPAKSFISAGSDCNINVNRSEEEIGENSVDNE